MSVPRFTPAESRSDFALGFRGGDGGGGGCLGGFLTGSFAGVGWIAGCMAKSTLVNRLEALTGGEEVGACTLGVSSAFTLGTGTFPLGILGVCRTGISTAGLTGGAGVMAGWGVALASPGGVPGNDVSEDILTMLTGSASNLIIGAPRGIGFAGVRGVFASDVFAHSGRAFLGARASSQAGLDSLTAFEVVELCATFCLFNALSAAQSFSFSLSFSCRASYGDTIGTDLPIGPLGVPSKVFSDL